MQKTDEVKKVLINRLKRIEGQVRGVAGMVSDDTYCVDIITQTSAIRQALARIEDLLMEDHLRSCAARQMSSGQTNKAVSEILQVYRLKGK